MWLMTEARSRGRRADAVLKVTLILTDQQIAARIGSAPEVVSRALSRLRLPTRSGSSSLEWQFTQLLFL
jgi:hypothetical protein